MSNQYRTNFDATAVIAKLNYLEPKLWKGLSSKGKSRFNKVAILKMVRAYELNVKAELKDDESEVWERSLHRCDVTKGYQGYVEKVMIKAWS